MSLTQGRRQIATCSAATRWALVLLLVGADKIRTRYTCNG